MQIKKARELYPGLNLLSFVPNRLLHHLEEGISGHGNRFEGHGTNLAVDRKEEQTKFLRLPER